MRILVGYERFGAVRDELRRRGHKAWSCDIEDDASGQIDPPHIKRDIWETLADPNLGTWDAAIFFPVCTYMCGSGLHWNNGNTMHHIDRRRKTDEAVANAKKLMQLPIPKIVMENPVGILSTAYRKPDVIVQPYMFGDDASKKTCFWLKGVKPLPLPPCHVWHPGRFVEWPKGGGSLIQRWSNQTDSGQNRLGPSADRAAKRGKTYPGVARYIADLIEQ